MIELFMAFITLINYVLIIGALLGLPAYFVYRSVTSVATIDDVKGVECINKRCVEHPRV